MLNHSTHAHNPLFLSHSCEKLSVLPCRIHWISSPIINPPRPHPHRPHRPHLILITPTPHPSPSSRAPFKGDTASQDPKYTLQTIFSSVQTIRQDTLQIDILQPTIFFAPCRRSFWRHPADVFWWHPADNTPCRHFFVHPADNNRALCRRSWLRSSQTLAKGLHSYL